MENLVSYIGAIHGRKSDMSIVKKTVSKETWLDQGFEVHKEETTYWFDNGVLIRRVQEQDKAPDELVCAECWICYEVLEYGQQRQVHPVRRSFNNACQESFWLALHGMA
jgi:uncharacterized CHY-type Zn-finger protein